MMLFLLLNGNSGDDIILVSIISSGSIESSNFSHGLDDVVKITLDVSWQVSADTEFELLQNGRGHAPDRKTIFRAAVELERKAIISIEDGGTANNCEAVITGTT